MPTHEELPEFRQAFDKLDASDQDLFIDAVEKFIGAIKRRDEAFSGKRIEFPKVLRVKGALKLRCLSLLPASPQRLDKIIVAGVEYAFTSR
jgi:hypothetical protein